MPFDPKRLVSYPTSIGVYVMKNHLGRVLYVGKANNLRARLKQYFTKRGDERETVLFLREEIEEIDTLVLPSEKDALLLENNLIKRHKPKYNVLLKDDKTFIRLMITDHTWPMIKLIRGKEKPKEAKYFFGPYTNAKAARQTYDILLKLFPLRQCSDSEFVTRTRPCLLYDIKRCCAPCVEKCTKEQYDFYVESARKLLLGKDNQILGQLKEKMEKASQRLAFEEANDYLQIIRHIEHVLSIQHVEHPNIKESDVIGFYREADTILIALLHYRKGKLLSSEHYTLHQILTEDEKVLQQFLLQHYHQDNIPLEIFLPFSIANIKVTEEILNERKKVSLVVPKRGDKKALIDIATQNAKALFERDQSQKSLKEKMLLDLQETLSLDRFPRRIECFDTSHTGGGDFVAAMVSYVNGEKDKSRQRLFHIKKVEKGSDYDAMKEVLVRHLTKAKEKNDFCDLVVLDGGKGHLNAAMDIFDELNIANVDLISIAKEKASHAKKLTQEKIFIPHEKDPILIHPHSPLLYLLQQIRDEAHRVAIDFHRKKRKKRLMRSELDEIEGIGPKKKKALLSHFKSIENIKKASRDELLQVKGLNQKDIERLLAL